MTKSATRIQDKDTQKRLSVVQSTEDPTKFWIVILNPDGSPVSWWWDARVFSLSSTSDLTNAQKAYNFLGRGKFPIIKYDDKFYLYAYWASNAAYFTVWNEKTIDNTSNSSFAKDGIKFDISSWNVTAINVVTVATSDSWFLRTGKNYGTPYTPEYDGSPATKKYVDDKVNDTAFGNTWDGDTTHSPSKNVVYDEINKIEEVIPSAATSLNQLTDKDYVNDSINSITAYYITKNAQGDQFATYLELSSATTFYSGGVVRVPTRNDYCIVQADENHDDATTRYIYQNNQWEYQYTVNETALTTAQLNALNSWITSWKVSTYDGYATSKQDALTLPTNPTQGNLMVWWANNKAFVDGGPVPTNKAAASWWNDDTLVTTGDKYKWNNKVDWPSSATNNHLAVFDGTTGKLIKDGGAVPTGVPSWWSNGDVLTNVSWEPTWQAISWWHDYSWKTKTWASFKIDLRSYIEPSQNFTVNLPDELEDGMEYVLRCVNGATAYTMTLGTGFTNPRNVSLSLNSYASDQFVFVAINGELELQPEPQLK